MGKNNFASIESIINVAKRGGMFILVDDKNRENEGDLVVPGSKCNSKIINFMFKLVQELLLIVNLTKSTQKQLTKLKL